MARIVELGRPVGLSGIWVNYEVQLDPAETRPVMDVFVVGRLGGAEAPPFVVPWTNDGRSAGEKSGRLALEIDRGTEGRRETELKAPRLRSGRNPRGTQGNAIIWGACFNTTPTQLMVTDS